MYGSGRGYDRDMKANAVALAGAVIGVVAALGVVRFVSSSGHEAASCAIEPMPSRARILVEDAGALASIVFHYDPRFEGVITPTYEDFFRALDPSVEIVAVIPREPIARPKLDELLVRTGRHAAHVLEIDAPISTWSKDRALVTRDPGALVVPPAPDPRWIERRHDWSAPIAVAGASGGRFIVRELPLSFDAGDFTVTGDDVLVDVNLWTKNRDRGSVQTPGALRELLERALSGGAHVTMLGERDGDVPRHHMSMYMAPLGAKTALVGDPRLARPIVGDAFVPGERSPDTGEPLRADFSDATTARFDRAARDLTAAGWRVDRVPVVPFDDKTYITYTNGVYETRAGTKRAYLPVYELPALDAAATAVYRRLGWEIVPVRVRALYPFHGTIGCAVNVLSRN